MAWEIFDKVLEGGYKTQTAVPTGFTFNASTGTFTSWRGTNWDYGNKLTPNASRGVFYGIAPNDNNTVTIGGIVCGFVAGSSGWTKKGAGYDIGSSNSYQIHCTMYLINHETQKGRALGVNYYSNDVTQIDDITRTMSEANLYLWLTNNIQPEYTWHSLNNIKGIDRTLQLTKIKDDYINNGDYIYYQDHASLETVGLTVPDMMSGLNVGDSKILVTTYQKDSDIMQLSIKRTNTSGFEIGALYSVGDSKAQFNIDCGGYGSIFFLGVLVDNEKEVATFSKIAISEDEVGINYNPPTKDFVALQTLSHFLYLIIKGVPRDIDEDDPTGELPPATDGGGDGDHNYTDDSVKPTPKPSNIATDLGLVTLFTPTNSQLKALASYMWTNDLFDLDNFKKIFADPMDCILSLGVYPFNLEASDNVALSVGNISTGILMNKLSTTEEYHDEKLGYCYIEKQLKTFLDYSPYTKLSVYLPFCSTHQLNADKYIGKNVYIFYRVNVLSGACVVYLCDGGYDGQILDQFSGNVNYNIPLTANNYQQAISSLLNLTLTTGGAVAGGVATGGASIGATVANTAQNISNLKPSIEHTGSLGGNIGSCGHLSPYFIFSCPRLVASDGKNKIIGTPSYVTKTLGDVTGYCEVQNVHVASSLANAREVAEIESLLKGGVYL